MAIELTIELAITYTAIMVMAIVPIYIGARRSLLQKQVETMTKKDAWFFPVIASGFLFGLYLLFKLLSKDFLNYLLKSYFLIFGVTAVAFIVQPLLKLLIPKLAEKRERVISLRIPLLPSSVGQYALQPLWIISIGVGIALSTWYILTGHWIANNILALAFSIQGISFISLGSYKTGCLLLCLLFFYDIFWVFGTDVMVSVARNFDAPIKLLFPRNILATSEAFEFAMLGLGDIVIPGVFIALLLRYDMKRANYAPQADTPFFTFAYFGYITGLATTIWVMHTFRAAQPALLYLVPACILSSLIAGLLLGELDQLFAYSEEMLTVKPQPHAKAVNGNEATAETPKKGIRKQKKINREWGAVTWGPQAELEAIVAVAESLRTPKESSAKRVAKPANSDKVAKNKRKNEEAAAKAAPKPQNGTEKKTKNKTTKGKSAK